MEYFKDAYNTKVGLNVVFVNARARYCKHLHVCNDVITQRSTLFLKKESAVVVWS